MLANLLAVVMPCVRVMADLSDSEALQTSAMLVAAMHLFYEGLRRQEGIRILGPPPPSGEVTEDEWAARRAKSAAKKKPERIWRGKMENSDSRCMHDSYQPTNHRGLNYVQG